MVVSYRLSDDVRRFPAYEMKSNNSNLNSIYSWNLTGIVYGLAFPRHTVAISECGIWIVNEQRQLRRRRHSAV